MVTFTCQNCNSCLKKKAVDNHLFKCKSAQLTCIDCLKDFDSQNYVGHVSCVTEDQRYGGKDFALTNSMQKQNQWNQSISQLLQKNISPKAVKDVIIYASENPNCPRNKKRFLNFVLNNRNFKSKEVVEKAFDLILEEFNKINSVDDKNNETLSGSKRKTISETEVQEADNLPTSNEKLSKKKNKKINCENGDAETVLENGFTNPKKSEKKSKKNNSENIKEDDCKSSKTGLDNVNGEEIQENGDSHITKVSDGKKKKKNKKDRKNSMVEQPPKSDEDIVDDNIDEQENEQTQSIGIENDSTELPKEDLSKLSKKERKKLLKQRKYEAEIVSIENYKKEEDVPVEEEAEKPKKKKKKQAEEEANRVQKCSLSEPEDKKIKLEVEEVQNQEIVEVEKPKKFKWDEIIIQVLQSQDDGEMSLKRLSKKVCGEYTNVHGERESYEEVLLKFNKKVLRTHGVKVFKDKAKLIMDS